MPNKVKATELVDIPKQILPAEFRNKIICGNAIDVMKKIPDGSVDLIITSPPYNLKNSTGNGMKDGRGGKWSNAALMQGYESHPDNLPHDEYAKWQRNCLTEMYRLIPEDGAIFYNHKWRVQGGLLQDRQDIVDSFPVRQIIIWRRKGGINFNRGYFLPTFEVIYMIAKPKFKLLPKANGVGDVWEFSQEFNNKHPAPFPVALIERIISSTDAKTVLDPFMGSGTTAVAAINHGRDYIGIDVAPSYCVMAEQRISNHIIQSKLPLNYNGNLMKVEPEITEDVLEGRTEPTDDKQANFIETVHKVYLPWRDLDDRLAELTKQAEVSL